jgi:fructose-1,6-bisphosphatase/inositol monophosphatase family enzyme
LGVVDHIVTDERWVGMRGAATTHNGATAQTRACTDLSLAILHCGSPDHFAPAVLPVLGTLKAEVRWTVYGGSCYAYGQLASGRIDLAFDDGLDAVDICALVPVIEGAGGRMTDWQGRPLGLGRTGRVLAAGCPALHRLAVQHVAEAVAASSQAP